ncbi:hypothetical protein ABPG72_014892 [Tetrahymena utriculariae]
MKENTCLSNLLQVNKELFRFNIRFYFNSRLNNILNKKDFSKQKYQKICKDLFQSNKIEMQQQLASQRTKESNNLLRFLQKNQLRYNRYISYMESKIICQNQCVSKSQMILNH